MVFEPFTQAEIALVRRAFARQLASIYGTGDNAALERAFARVAREDFLGPPPWRTSVDRGIYHDVEISDPVALYQDLVWALDPARGVNNGSPSLHLRWLDALRPLPGERVAHIGAGTGYYSAILAELVGPEGSVIAVEYDGTLAAAARENLRHYEHVQVVHGDGTALPDAPADCIYVNFGVERPASPWIDRLKPGGRLVFPLGYRSEASIAGGGFLIWRDDGGYAARFLGRAYFIPAEAGTRVSLDERERLRGAFQNGEPAQVRRLIWCATKPKAGVWFAGDDWALCAEPST